MYPEPRSVELDGRTLTMEDAGTPGGFPVLVHGGGGSRHLEPAAIREARRHGLRLISYDRPAYGGSTPMPGRLIADCRTDVDAILNALGISRIAVWGFSGGGPYALATAALLPDAVAAVCVLAPLGPYGVPGLDFLDGMDDSYREEVRLFSEEAAARDGWTQGDDGWWDDWSAFLSPWGFDLDAITAPASLWHGLADTRCPPAHGRWLAERVPHCIAHFPEGEDHTNVEENNRSDAYTWLGGLVR
jgi:pimeloyl-ACP methyl ester carboxylesterase